MAETPGKLVVVWGCSRGGRFAAGSARAAVISSENLQPCDSHLLRRRRRATPPRTPWTICSQMRRKNTVLDVSVGCCLVLVADCIRSSLPCPPCPRVSFCARSAPPAQQRGGSCPAGRLRDTRTLAHPPQPRHPVRLTGTLRGGCASLQAGAGGPGEDIGPRSPRCGHHAQHPGAGVQVRVAGRAQLGQEGFLPPVHQVGTLWWQGVLPASRDLPFRKGFWHR